MKRSLSCLLIVSLLTLAVGCSSAWLSDVSKYVQLAAPAVIDILDIIALSSHQPVNAQLVSKVNGDASAIETVANDLAKASASAAPGVCSQLNADLGIFSQDLAQVMQLAQVSPKESQDKVAPLAQLVSNTIAQIETLIPQCQAGHSAKALILASKVMPPGTFARSFNSVLVAKTGNAVIDEWTPKHKLPARGVAFKVATLGLVR